MGDPVHQYLPATAADWQYARPGVQGGVEYTQDNPAWGAEELRKAREHQAYLADLMRRQAGLTLGSAQVGKGMTENPSEQPSLFQLMRLLSQGFLGQPYGMMAPPTTGDVNSAAAAVQAAEGRQRPPRGLLPSLGGR